MGISKTKKLKNIIEKKHWTSDFQYLPEDSLPSIVFGIKIFSDYDLRYWDMLDKTKREWKKIAHQTAGIGCHQHHMFGTILSPKKGIEVCLNKLNDIWLDSCCGAFGVSLDEVLQYRENLIEFLDVDCNETYQDFEEGIAPIDCGSELENLKKLTNESFPKSAADADDMFLKFDNSLDRLIGSMSRWRLFILMQNCD